MPVTSPKNTYQLKVTLNGTKPPIWRRILVPADIRLGELHQVIQAVMGWEDAHLHHFIVGRTFYGMQDGQFAMDDDTEDENKYALNDLLQSEKKSLKYEYDFGDSWEHSILLEKILPYEEGGAPLPRCIKGARACPPEDCGGVWGYQALLDTLSDPQHPEYEEMLEWIGGEFDAELFDIDQANEALGIHVK